MSSLFSAAWCFLLSWLLAVNTLLPVLYSRLISRQRSVTQVAAF